MVHSLPQYQHYLFAPRPLQVKSTISFILSLVYLLVSGFKVLKVPPSVTFGHITFSFIPPFITPRDNTTESTGSIFY